MIAAVFWDLDECLIHTELFDPDQQHHKFLLDDGKTYFSMFRPCARRVVDFSRDLVGSENVYVLTTSTTDYANEINIAANLGFRPEQIFAREDLRKRSYRLAYGGSGMMPHPLANRNNVLIDNLSVRDNPSKMDFIGITENRYCLVSNYFGVNFPDDTFEEDVKKFLIEANK